MTLLIVPDVSFYQDDNATPQGIDFAKMKAAGVAGVIIRAGQNSWQDPDFKTNWRAAKEAGLRRGSYWLYDSRTEPAKQTNLWHAAIAGDYPELGLWADFEENYGGAYGEEKHYKQFVLAVNVYFPTVLLGVYTAWGWWNKAGRISDNSFWSAYPLWVANYGVTSPLIPKSWKEWLFWQFTASGDGAKYGVESKEIDLNYIDEDKFRSVFGGSVPQEGKPMASKWYRVTANALNVRTGPGASYTDVGDLLKDDIIEVLETVGGWHHFDHIYRNGKMQDAPAVAWCSGAYTVLTTAPVTPPPADVHPVEATVKMSDGTVYKSTEWVKQ